MRELPCRSNAARPWHCARGRLPLQSIGRVSQTRRASICRLLSV